MLVAWGWAIITIGPFMVSMLGAQHEGTKAPSVADFTKELGPWIIIATVFVPLVVAATMNWLKRSWEIGDGAADTDHSGGRAAANHMYGAWFHRLRNWRAGSAGAC